MTRHEWKIHTLPNGVKLRLPGPFVYPEGFTYVETEPGQVAQCLAAWNTDDGGPPMHLLFHGPPGCGKNSLAYKLARETGKDLFLLLGHEELDSQDVVASAVLRDNSQIEYVASPLLAAVITGGIVLFDEISKCRPRALAVLSTLLEGGVVHSDILGLTFKAHPDFRFIAAMNPADVDAYVLPPWLQGRLNARLELRMPPWSTLREIVAENLMASMAGVHEGLDDIERLARDHDLSLSPRELNNVVSLANRFHRGTLNMPWPDAVLLAFQRVMDVVLGSEAVHETD